MRARYAVEDCGSWRCLRGAGLDRGNRGNYGRSAVEAASAEAGVVAQMRGLPDCDAMVADRRGASAPRVVIMGRPGAGKGTQGVRLAQRLGVQYLSTGDLLRHEIAIESDLGVAVERLVSAGRLVPTGLMVAMVDTNLGAGGYVLDGFPRTIAQAKAFFERSVNAPTIAVEVNVTAHVALARLTARGRSDDDPTVARERLATYEAETAPALDWLDARGLLVSVDGHESASTVEQGMLRELMRARVYPHDASVVDLRFAEPPRPHSALFAAESEHADD